MLAQSTLDVYTLALHHEAVEWLSSGRVYEINSCICSSSWQHLVTRHILTIIESMTNPLRTFMLHTCIYLHVRAHVLMAVNTLTLHYVFYSGNVK